VTRVADVIDALRVAPGSAPGIAARDTRDDLGLKDKHEARAVRGELTARLAGLQERLFAEGRRSVLLVLQGLDASGKDGVIRSVFSGVNPQGVHVTSFRAPTETERAHDYLWRIHAALPARGMMGAYNRSHYEDVVAVRIHELVPAEVWRRRPAPSASSNAC
jgi:polyphosphate kinase 2 (PPK2 family)